MPSAAKFAYLDGAGMLEVVWFRSVFAVFGLVATGLLMRNALAMPKAEFSWLALLGLLQTVGALGIIGSFILLDISLASLIIFSFPFYVAIYNHVTGRSKLSLAYLGTMMGVAMGLGMVLSVDFGSVNILGLGLAFLGSLFAALMVVNVTPITNRLGSVRVNTHLNIWASIYYTVAAFILLPAVMDDGLNFPESLIGWAAIAGTGLAFAFGFVLFFLGAGLIGTTRASVLSLMEPLLMIGGAVVLLGERPERLQWLGIGIALAFLLAGELISRGKAERNSAPRVMRNS
jgi:drug/metabolite transporter (DMT)-like permease